jgi:hypothetical protein
MKGVLILVLQLWAALAVAEVHERVKFAIDKKHGLNPSSHQVVSNKLFKFQYLSSSKELDDDVDMFAYAQWEVAEEILQKSHNSIVPQIRVPKDTNDLFENKARWKAWMVSIGMGDYIPMSINLNVTPSVIRFPIVLKSSRKQFGEGVRIIRSTVELKEALKEIPEEEQDTVVVEESLLGMGLHEMTSFGSSYQGRLLSLRCSLRSVNATNASVSASNTSEPFVRSNSVKWADDHGVACGQDLVRVVGTMLAHSNYTGAFCIDWKMDNQGRMKMLEMNARVCGTQRKVYGDGLVVSAFVPLSFAVLQDNKDPKFRDRSALLRSTQSSIYHIILAMEECALQTGGGLFPTGWETVKSFNMSRATVPLIDTYLALIDETSERRTGGSSNFSCPIKSMANATGERQ